MKILSQRFQAELEFDDNLVIQIPHGLLGFPESKRFCILELDQDGAPFKWFHDVDDTSIAFLITDPYQFFPEYNPRIQPKHIGDLKIENTDQDMMLFTIVKVIKGGMEAFTNLRAPVIVNAKTRMAKQIILEQEEYSVKTAIFRENDVREMQRETMKQAVNGD